MPVGAALGLSGVAGAIGSVFGAQSAAAAQTKSAKLASKTQQNIFNSTTSNITPYSNFGADLLKNSGVSALNFSDLQSNAPKSPMPAPISPFNITPYAAMADFNPTQKQLETTPGYQFALSQGSKAVNNQFAAQGLGGANSGALGKGLANYAQGLASNTYQQQFQNYMNQYQQQYQDYWGQQQQEFSDYWSQNQQLWNNQFQTGQQAFSNYWTGVQGAAQPLESFAGIGAGAAGSLVGAGSQLATNIGNNITGAGNAQGAANIASGNAFGTAAGALAGGYAFNSLFPGATNNNIYQPQQQPPISDESNGYFYG